MLNVPFQSKSIHGRGVSRTTIIVATILWAGVFGGLIFIWQGRIDNAQAAPQVDNTDSVVKPGQNPSSVKISFPARKLPDFLFEDCTGGTLGLEDLKGKRWVASFIFTSCTTTCPTISRAMMEVHDRVQKDAPDVMFVSFTVYPRVDTAERLKTYSETFTKGNWDRWKFLTGSQQQIYELIVKGFGLYVKENVEASKMPGFEVAHSNRVVLVNEDGIPVGTFLGTKDEDMVRLRRILTGKEEFPEPGSGAGLTFSTTDGNPLGIEFQVQPAEGDDEANETSPPLDSSTEGGDLQSRSSAEVTPDRVEQTSTQAESAVAATRSAEAHNRSIDERLPSWAQVLPTVNSGLNTLSAVLLMTGLVAIKQGRKATHRNLMITAFVTSAVFLICYLTYHYALGKYTGEHGRKFPGDGPAAIIYQLILWPHIILAVFVPFLAIRVFQHAFSERWDAHKRLARITFPIWIFVSITGVVIYGMLYHWPWPADTAISSASLATIS